MSSAAVTRPTAPSLLLDSGDEAGTPPDDRPFRPDIQGLRAVAVSLVVLYHARIPGFPGGYIGVDVFFVVSGFVITGLLLRERTVTGGTSMLTFYARRSRRILPAATLVILATVAATYLLLGLVRGNPVADDGRWASVFLSNFHSIWNGADYFGAQSATSPLEHFWSLAVEEQFYLVFPVLFIAVASIKSRLALRLRIALLLGLVIASSLAFSIVETHASPLAAYFSPFTRAWELALGALVAVIGPHWRRLTPRVGLVLGWLGVAGILVAAFAYSGSTPYPGIAVALPVVSTALVIIAGLAVPAAGPEWILGRWLGLEIGAISYSLYLWHFPVLIIPQQHAGHMLSLVVRFGLLALSVALAWCTYRFVENPLRHNKRLSSSRGASLGLGGVLISATLIICTVYIAAHHSGGTTSRAVRSQTATLSVLAPTLEAAVSQPALPFLLMPPLDQVSSSPLSGDAVPAPCIDHHDDDIVIPRSCVFGDRSAARSIVLYGDSQAEMWASAYSSIAERQHARLYVFAKDGCAPWLKLYYSTSRSSYLQCDAFHRWATQRIIGLHPTTVYVTGSTGVTEHPYEVQGAAIAALRSLAPSRARLVVLSNIPWFTQFSGTWPPACIGQNPQNLHACNLPVSSFTEGDLGSFRQQLRNAAGTTGAGFVVLDRLFCTASTCPVVVGNRVVYQNYLHTTSVYAEYVNPALEELLRRSSVPAPQGATTTAVPPTTASTPSS